MDVQQRGDADVINLGDGSNSFDGEQATALLALLNTLGSTSTPLVLVGTGKYWCTGLDLVWMKSHKPQVDQVIDDVHRIVGTLMLIPRPTVAAINGHAIGAGAMLAMACDQRVMGDSGGYLRFPEVDLALAPTRAMTNLIVARVGRSVSAQVLLSGRPLGAQEAAALGLVDRCVPGSELLETAIDMAQPFAGKDPRTMAAIKRRIWGDVAEGLLHAPGQMPSIRSGL